MNCGCSRQCAPACLLLQALIYKYVPIIGPIVGSAFIIGLYMLSRLVKGDLTDRMNMMSQVRVFCAHPCLHVNMSHIDAVTPGQG